MVTDHPTCKVGVAIAIEDAMHTILYNAQVHGFSYCDIKTALRDQYGAYSIAVIPNGTRKKCESERRYLSYDPHFWLFFWMVES